MSRLLCRRLSKNSVSTSRTDDESVKFILSFGNKSLNLERKTKTMKNLVLPYRSFRRLPFYLAMEEWAARTLPDDEYFFAWRVCPTVICGRNQNISEEVDTDYCRRQGIDVVRRKSGGGAVYADLDNYMFSYISPGSDVDTIFHRYTAMIVGMLQSLGIDAEASGRNDILAGNSKIAGNAFYKIGGRSVVHGTMLYSIDVGRMQRAITPSRAKLESKAVVSVPMRVISLKDCGLDIDIEAFGLYAVRHLCGQDEYVLSQSDVQEVETIEQSYYDPLFVNGHPRKNLSRTPDIVRKSRIGGVGEFETAVDIDTDGRISALGIWGDFFPIGDIHEGIISRLIGVDYSRDSIAGAVDRIDTGSIIKGLTKENLLNLLI